MDRDFKGIWIPKEIWLSTDLTLQEKVFYVEIDSLNNEKWCFANNDYFSKFFGISKVRVSEVISSLIKKWYLSSEIKYEEGNKRILMTLIKESLWPSQTKVYDPHKGKFKHNNIVNNITNNNSSKEEDKSLEIPEEFGNKDINAIISTIKEFHGTIDWTVKENRYHWNLLKWKLDKITWFNWDYHWFIKVILENTDEYNVTKTTSCKSLYYNLAALVAKTKSKFQEANKPKWSTVDIF